MCPRSTNSVRRELGDELIIRFTERLTQRVCHNSPKGGLAQPQEINSQNMTVHGGTRANWLRPGALGILPSIFFQIVINRWNSLDQRTVDASSINVFKSRLIYIRDNRMGFFMD